MKPNKENALPNSNMKLLNNQQKALLSKLYGLEASTNHKFIFGTNACEYYNMQQWL